MLKNAEKEHSDSGIAATTVARARAGQTITVCKARQKGSIRPWAWVEETEGDLLLWVRHPPGTTRLLSQRSWASRAGTVCVKKLLNYCTHAVSAEQKQTQAKPSSQPSLLPAHSLMH